MLCQEEEEEIIYTRISMEVEEFFKPPCVQQRVTKKQWRSEQFQVVQGASKLQLGFLSTEQLDARMAAALELEASFDLVAHAVASLYLK